MTKRDQDMELIDNRYKTLRNDLCAELKREGKVSIGVACFSIYVFEK